MKCLTRIANGNATMEVALLNLVNDDPWREMEEMYNEAPIAAFFTPLEWQPVTRIPSTVAFDFTAPQGKDSPEIWSDADADGESDPDVPKVINAQPQPLEPRRDISKLQNQSGRDISLERMIGKSQQQKELGKTLHKGMISENESQGKDFDIEEPIDKSDTLGEGAGPSDSQAQDEAMDVDKDGSDETEASISPAARKSARIQALEDNNDGSLMRLQAQSSQSPKKNMKKNKAPKRAPRIEEEAEKQENEGRTIVRKRIIKRPRVEFWVDQEQEWELIEEDIFVRLPLCCT